MTDSPRSPSPARSQEDFIRRLQQSRPVAEQLKVFLSHAAKDASLVNLVRRQLQALGVSVYLAEDDPRPGTVLAEKVRAAIHNSHVVVVLITTAGLNSAYVQQEVGIAHECGKPIVPIVEKGIEAGTLGILQGVEYLELDLDHPAETMAKMTAHLQPLVMQQLSVNVAVVTVNQPAPNPLVLIGLGLFFGVLLMAALSSGGGGFSSS